MIPCRRTYKLYYVSRIVLCRFDLSDPIADLKEKATATWALGSYNDIATFLSPMSAHLVRMPAVSQGEQVLDVAVVQALLPSLRAEQERKVTGIDITSELLARAKEETVLPV